MHQSIETSVPRVCKPGPWGGDLTARAITGSGDNSRDLTRRTEGRTIGKVMGKKSGKGG